MQVWHPGETAGEAAWGVALRREAVVRSLDTRAGRQTIKRMPTGQMEMLFPDRLRGVLHKHVHIRRPSQQWLPGVAENLYPKYTSLREGSKGLHLRFPNLELEEARNRKGRKK